MYNYTTAKGNLLYGIRDRHLNVLIPNNECADFEIVEFNRMGSPKLTLDIQCKRMNSDYALYLKEINLFLTNDPLLPFEEELPF